MPDPAPVLLPCPFCGSGAVAMLDMWGEAIVRCQNNLCEAETWGPDQFDAIARWNRRANPEEK